MKIPSDTFVRAMFFEDVIRHCMASNADRISFYNKMRQVYLFGMDPADVGGALLGKYRKILAHIDLVSSFLYAQDTTKFSIHLGATAEKMHTMRTDRMAQILNDDWHDTDTDLLFGEGLRWSLVYGAMIGKSMWRRAPVFKLIEPHNFGVYREDVILLSEQEAMVQRFQMTRTELDNRIASHPRRGEIMKLLVEKPRDERTEMQGQSNILVSQVNPIVGNVSIDLSPSNQYTPRVSQDLVECYELWIWDDDIDGWRVVTTVDPGVPIYDRPAFDEEDDKRMFCKGITPFTLIRPRPALNYFWGESEVEILYSLQNDYNEEIVREKKRLKRSANPPKSAVGFTFDSNEASDAWDIQGGIITSDMPGAKMEIHQVEEPENIGGWLRQLDSMFEEISGIPPAMKGLGTPGVRSDVHNRNIVQVGGSRIKKRALMVEDSLDDLATKYIDIHRTFDATHYVDKKGEKFICAQFTDDFIAKVDAHSNSPVFVDDQKDVADRALKAKAITRERYLEMIGAPNLPVLKQELSDIIEPGEQAAQEKQQRLEESKLMMQAGKGDGKGDSGLLQKISALLRTARGAGQ